MESLGESRHTRSVVSAGIARKNVPLKLFSEIHIKFISSSKSVSFFTEVKASSA